MRILFLAVILVLLSGCGPQYIQSEEGAWIPLGPGSQVDLLSPIEVPAGRSRVFIQHGKVVSPGGVDTYDTSCNFETRYLGPEVTVIQADTFLIESVEIGSEQVVQRAEIRVAALALRGFRDSAPSVHRLVRFRLVSGEQPDVLSLTCRGPLADLWESRLPDLGEIKEALGSIARLVLYEE